MSDIIVEREGSMLGNKSSPCFGRPPLGFRLLYLE